MELKYDLSDFLDVLTKEKVMVGLVNRVRLRRKELGLSQKQLALKSDVSYASIRRFENTGEISLVSLLKIAISLDSLEDFNSLFSKPKIKNLKDYKVD